MRRLLPLALLLAACAKREEAPAPPATPKPPAVDTPEAMAKAMDLPLYPGAEAPDGMSSASKRRSDGSTHYLLVLATKDPVAKAAAFYAKALKTRAMGGVIFAKSPNGNDVSVVAATEAGRTLIRLKSIVYAR